MAEVPITPYYQPLKPEKFSDAYNRLQQHAETDTFGELSRVEARELGLCFLATLASVGPRLYKEMELRGKPSGALSGFLETVFDYQAHEIPQVNQERRLSTLGLHYVAGLTLEEIGKIEGLTKERVRQVRDDALEGLANNLPPLKSGEPPFDLSQIKARVSKPKRQSGREVISESKDVGLGERRSRKEIALIIARIAAFAPYPEAAKTVQALISQLHSQQLHRLTVGENPPLSRLRDEVEAAGFYYNNRKVREVAAILEQFGGIKVFSHKRHVGRRAGHERVGCYYYLSAPQAKQADIGEAIERAIETRPECAEVFKNPVEQIAGPAIEALPTTYELDKPRDFGYKTIKALVFTLSPRYPQQLSFARLFDASCPVAVLRAQRYVKTLNRMIGSYYYESTPENRKALIAYLNRRLKELEY